MKKKLAKLTITLLTVAILCANVLPLFASAESVITPRYSNCYDCTCYFVANSGQAYVSVTYTGNSSTFSYAKSTVKLQTRFLGIFWSTVDIGYTDNEWIAYNYDTDGYFSNSFPLEDTGTYRAVFTVEIYGKDGSVDTIEDKITSTYD